MELNISDMPESVLEFDGLFLTFYVTFGFKEMQMWNSQGDSDEGMLWA